MSCTSSLFSRGHLLVLPAARDGDAQYENIEATSRGCIKAIGKLLAPPERQPEIDVREEWASRGAVAAQQQIDIRLA